MQWGFQSLVASHMRLLPCISWKNPKRNLCHLDWTFNIRTLNWTFTYGIGLEEEKNFRTSILNLSCSDYQTNLWVYSNGLWSYHKLSVLKKNIPSIPNISPTSSFFSSCQKEARCLVVSQQKKQHRGNMIDAFLETKHIRAEISSPPPTNRSYVYIPRTQTTLVLIGKGLVWGVDLQK